MTKPFQPTILRFDSIDSTNLEAMRQARAGAVEGLCVIAREQTAGRGRLNRTWQSARDAGMYFSIVLRPAIDLTLWPLLPLLTALAVSDSLMKSSGLRCDIKWPNDIYVDGRKICGILAETVETSSGIAAIVGIGINLKADGLSDELRSRAISVEEAIGAEVDPDMILESFVCALAERYEVFQQEDGCEHTIREWCANSSYAFDRQVRVTTQNDTLIGTTRGLESDGALRLETADGRIKIVRAGDVTAVRPAT